jgi:hypothetical protein
MDSLGFFMNSITERKAEQEENLHMFEYSLLPSEKPVSFN